MIKYSFDNPIFIEKEIVLCLTYSLHIIIILINVEILVAFSLFHTVYIIHRNH